MVDIINTPYRAIYAAEVALKRIDVAGEAPPLHFRIKNLPETRKIEIRDLRATHLGKFIAVDGLVKKVKVAKFVILLWEESI